MTKIVTVLILLQFVVSNANAETGTILFKASSNKIEPLPKALTEQRTDYEDPDKFYRTFFGKTDAQVKGIYESQWKYHEAEVNYILPAWRNEFLSRGSLSTTYTWQVRRQFAEQVLRMRADSGIRAALYEIKNPALTKSYARVKDTMDKINNYPLRLSNKKGSKAGEFRVGYDVLSDSAKIEYGQGNLESGLYHPGLVGLMTKQKTLDAANFRLSSNFGSSVPKASLAVPMTRHSVEGSLSHSLSPSVSATFTTGHPWTNQAVAHSYNASISYTF